jgi:hypothetical protein
MNTTEFKTWVQGKMLEHPLHKTEIADFYYLALSEIEEGGSTQHEISLAVNDINELINGNI